MANVNDCYLFRANSIIDNIWIAAEPEGVHTQIGNHAVPNHGVPKCGDPFVDMDYDGTPDNTSFSKPVDSPAANNGTR